MHGRNARVLVAVGDSLGGQRADNQLLDRALSAAVDKGAQQFILVTPLGGAAGGGGVGGFLGNLFGGGGGSSKKPSKIERQVKGQHECLILLSLSLCMKEHLPQRAHALIHP